jgi:hypothetical protein
MLRSPVDLEAATRDVRNRCGRAASNIDMIAQTKDANFQDPRQIMLELVLAITKLKRRSVLCADRGGHR